MSRTRFTISRCLFGVLIFFAAGSVWAAEFWLQNLRMWHAPNRTQIVFDLSGDIPYQMETLRNPDRFFIDIPNADLRGSIPNRAVYGPYIRGIRTGQPVAGTLRVVFDLAAPVTPRAELLKPTGVYGYRLAID